MKCLLRILLSAAVALPPLVAGGSAIAQKYGGTLRVFHRDSPANMSIHEEGTISVIAPIMPIFNNLVVFNQHEKQNRLDNIVPDLAESWNWSEDGKDLTFKLRQGVKWHDGKPFTAADVKCTWDLLAGRAQDRLRTNFRAAWYENLAEVTASGDYEVTFRLKQRQPAFLALLASGYSPVYPCHVPAKDMRVFPIGTGPFKFVEYKPNQGIRLARNPDYWRPDRPYLDGIEWTIIPNRSTSILGFVSGKFDMTFPYDVTVPLLKDIKNQAPQAVCEMRPVNVRTTLLPNHRITPFDNVEVRRALALALDRQAFITIISEGTGDMGGVMLPPPEGAWGMSPEQLLALPGYGNDVAKNRAEARELMKKAGYGPDKRLKVTLSARNLPSYRDPAAILIDQLKDIWIDAELEPVETANWGAKLRRFDFTIALALSGSAVDDPDPQYIGNYICGTLLNYTGFCHSEMDRLIQEQSMQADPEIRKEIVFKIERILAEHAVRPVIYYNRAGTCWHPPVKGLTVMANSPYNGWRMEDVWLDR
jgi:peptide/nickel transport system substrate-binding protein